MLGQQDDGKALALIRAEGARGHDLARREAQGQTLVVELGREAVIAQHAIFQAKALQRAGYARSIREHLGRGSSGRGDWI